MNFRIYSTSHSMLVNNLSRLSKIEKILETIPIFVNIEDEK